MPKSETRLKSVIALETTVSRSPRLREHLAAVRRNWDFLAVLLLAAATMPVTLLSPRNLLAVDPPNIDDSWFVDVCYKATHGVWLGGGVVSTYGPVIQWLVSAPGRWTGYSMGKVYATWLTLPMWAAFLLTAFTLQLLLPEQPPWKRFVLILFLFTYWASPSWAPPDVRPFVGTFLFALFLRGWYATNEQRINPILFGVVAGVLCPLAFLVAADTGVYAIAGLLITLAGVLLEFNFRREFLRTCSSVLAATVLSACLAVLVINTLFARPFNFTFWKASLAMVGSYRWYFPFKMEVSSKALLLTTLTVAVLVFALRYFMVRSDNTFISGRRGFLLSAFVFGFLGMQSGLVRSDVFHVQLSLLAMTLFIGVILFGFESGTAASTVAVVLGLTFCWFMVNPNQTYSPSSIRDRYGVIAHPYGCSEGWVEFDHACFKPVWAKIFEDSKSYVQQRTTPRDSILVFPWNNIFGSVTERNVAGGVMLSYVASDTYLSNVNIRRLAGAAPPVGLYFSEGWGWPVDGVPNFTRNAPLWFWIQSHYETDEQLASGILGLRRNFSRAAKIKTQSETLQLPLQRYPVASRVSTIDLGSPVWPQRGADFLRIRLNVHYPFWWRLRKPVRSQLEVTRADGSRKTITFVLPPGVSTDVWFHPWDNDVLGFFAPDEAQWHVGSNPAITHMRLSLTPIDWISVIPDSVSVETVDAVRLTMQH